MGRRSPSGRFEPDDATELGRFFADLSLESRVFRFFAAVVNANSSIQRMVNVNYTSSYGLVAVSGAEAQIIGHAMYVEIAPRKAEMALAVADAYQDRGLGTILLGQLAEAAAAVWVRDVRGGGPAGEPPHAAHAP